MNLSLLSKIQFSPIFSRVIIGILIFSAFTYSQEINITGTILDSDSLSVENAEVILMNQVETEMSDSNGVFTFTLTTVKNQAALKKLPQSVNLTNSKLSITSTKKNQKLSIKLFNLQGRIVKEMNYDNISEGLYSININTLTSTLSNGLFIIKVKVGSDKFIKKYLKRTNQSPIGANSVHLKKSTLHRRALVNDTLIINRANYKTQKVPINSYNINLSNIYLENDTNSVEINERTKVINDTVLSFIDTNSTPDSLIINSGSAVFDSLKVGDIIVSGPSDLFPYGVFKKVSSISVLNNQAFIKTEDAALTEAIDNCNISISGTLAVDSSDDRGSFFISLEKKFDDVIKTTGTANIGINFDYDLKIEKIGFIPIIKKFGFKYIFDVNYDVKVIASASAKDSVERKIFEKPFAPIVIMLGGFLPLVIQPEFQVDLGILYETSLELSIGVEKRIIEEIGATFHKGVWIPHFRMQLNESEFEYPKFDVKINTKIEPYLKGKLNFLFGNTVGPYGGIRFGASYNQDLLGNPYWDITSRITPVVGSKLEFINKTVFDTSFTLGVGYKKLHMMAGPNSFKCQKIEDDIIVEWDSEFSGADTFFVYASKSPNISKTEYDHVYLAKSSPCTLAISDYGGASTWYFMTTAYNGMHKVESQPSDIDSIEIILDFEADREIAPIIGPIRFIINTNIDEIDSYEWDFGDGNTSNKRDPIHEYEDIGLYTVKCKMSGPNYPEKIIEKLDYITIQIDTIRTYYETLELKTVEEITDTLRIDSTNGDFYRDTINHGYYHEYYKSGREKVFELYDRARLDSTRTTYHDTIPIAIESIGHYILGVKHGDFYTYYVDGIIHSYTPWVYDTIHGFSYRNYPSGTLEHYVPWINGEIYGNILDFFDNGDTAKITPFELGESNDLNGTVKAWWPSTHNIKQITEFVNENLHGIHQEYSEQGILIKDHHYNMGIQDGTFYNYFLDGHLARKMTFNNGAPIGEYVLWDSTKTYVKEWSFNSSSKINGPYTITADEVIVEEFSFNNEKPVGEYQCRYLSGEIKISGMLDGCKVGEWTHFSEDGKITDKYIYSGERNRLSSYIEFNNNGIEQNDSDYVLITFYPSENKNSYATYEDGQLNGPYYQYYDMAGENKSVSGRYTENNRTGTWYRYDESGAVTDSTEY